MSTKIEQVDLSQKIRELYAIRKELELQFPGRKFTPDGHLVGSIGEVLVADCYGLKLLPNSTEIHDAIGDDGKFVQIKATQIKRIAISSEPDHLIVIKISDSSEWEEVYNGPGSFVWRNAGKCKRTANAL